MGGVRGKSPLPLGSVFSSVFLPAPAPEVTMVQAVSLLPLKSRFSSGGYSFQGFGIQGTERKKTRSGFSEGYCIE